MVVRYYLWIVACVFLLSLAWCSLGRTECLSSASEVRATWGHVHAYWGTRVPGYEGEKCWSRLPIAIGKVRARLKHLTQTVAANDGHKTQSPLVSSETATGIEVRSAGAALSKQAAPSPPNRDSLDEMLEEMGWVDYLVTYSALVNYGINLWYAEYCCQ
jgi:hypothetical protein